MILKMQLQFRFRSRRRWTFYSERILSNFSEKCQENKKCACIYALNKCNAYLFQLQNFSKIFTPIIFHAAIQNALSSTQFSRTIHSMAHLCKPHLMTPAEVVLEVQVKHSAAKFHLLDQCKEFYFLQVCTKASCLPLWTKLHTNFHQQSKLIEIVQLASKALSF